MDRSLEGKVAIVTGAGPGIGRATALRLAEDGAEIVVAARRKEPLIALAQEVEAATGCRALAIPTDLKDLAAGEALIDQAHERFGRIDALVNVATHPFKRQGIAGMDWSGYAESVQLNVVGTMKVCGDAALRMAENGGGAIVNISTLSTSIHIPKNSEYGSTKAAMVAMSKTLAREMGRKGIRVNIVTPGYTTGADLDALFAKMAAGAGTTAEEMSRQVADEAELKRHVDPEDIAEACLFLLSDRARNITGVELEVTAGAKVR